MAEVAARATGVNLASEKHRETRDKITEETGGAVSVDASPKSDLFSGKYSTVTYLFVNALLDSPLGKKIPGWAREALATVTDAHLVATGVVSVKRFKDSQRRLEYGQHTKPKSFL